VVEAHPTHRQRRGREQVRCHLLHLPRQVPGAGGGHDLSGVRHNGISCTLPEGASLLKRTLPPPGQRRPVRGRRAARTSRSRGPCRQRRRRAGPRAATSSRRTTSTTSAAFDAELVAAHTSTPTSTCGRCTRPRDEHIHRVPGDVRDHHLPRPPPAGPEHRPAKHGDKLTGRRSPSWPSARRSTA
jgi:hypothetical protein